MATDVTLADPTCFSLAAKRSEPSARPRRKWREFPKFDKKILH
ncbi:hypothetical protein SAMCFNEI73_Ch1125 [Sinorhizobium americanum]|uniref:Uncharacterized protein n=1 Tax=Sinorhizobium americanum TaxID=194963 RepID=A0A1L3LK20_9HYPH|nr:hypothetical protein SAMCCGM7_Ch1116 [Sinorhizobium americanum CCGM7]APG90442.1 hypothetical protein SAMCFNEI73_Ch1125 [Sinorhizobium americanum]